MIRVKTKPKKPRITLTQEELDGIKRKERRIATDRATLLVLCAAADVKNLTEDDVVEIMVTTSRYASHIDNHLAELEDARKSIEKKTGLKLNGWV